MSAIDFARKLVKKAGEYADSDPTKAGYQFGVPASLSKLPQFIRDNPTPASYIRNKISPPVVSPVQSQSKLLQKLPQAINVGKSAISSVMPGYGAYDVLKNKAPELGIRLAGFAQNNPTLAGKALQLEQPVTAVKERLLNPYKPVSLPEMPQPESTIGKIAQFPARAGYNFLVKPAIEGLANAPANYISGVTKTGLNLGRSSRGDKVSAGEMLEAPAKVAKSILDLTSIPTFGKVAGKAAGAAMEKGLREVVFEGAKSGAKFGGAYGGLQGIIDNKDTKDIFTYLSNVGLATGGGAAVGGVAGGGMAAVGYGMGKAFGKLITTIRKIFPEKSQEQAAKEAKGFIRDELGRFAGINKKKQKQEPVYYGDLRESLGLPRYADPESGAINFGAEIGSSKKSVPLTTTGQTPPPRTQMGTLPKEANGVLSRPLEQPTQLSGLQQGQKGRTSATLAPEQAQPLEDIIAEGRKNIGTSTKKIDTRSISQAANDFYTQWVDRYNPISQASKKVKVVLKGMKAELRPENDPNYLVRRLTGAGGIADVRFRRELEPVIKQLDKFKIDKLDMDTYLAHKRMAGFGQAGRDIYGADPVKSQQIVGALETKYGPEISKIADQLYSYQAKGFQEMVDAGFISPENASIIKQQNPDYSPLYRVMDDVNDYLGLPTRKTMQGSQPIKKIKGSERQIESPLESIIGNTFSQRAAIEKNRVAKAIVELQKIDPALEITPLRTAENVTKRIDIYKDIGELGQQKRLLNRLMTTRNRWVRLVQSELNKLNQQGLGAYLKQSPIKPQEFSSSIREKTGFERPLITTDTGDTFRGPAMMKGRELQDIYVEPTAAEVKTLVNDLVNSPPDVITAIKGKIATRENRLSGFLDQLDQLRSEVTSIKDKRNSLFDEAKLIRDVEAKGKSTITVWKNGIKELYEVPKDIADVAKGANEESMNMVLKLIQKPASLLRQGATGRNPEFMAPNIIRDQLDAGISSKYGYIPFVDYFSGLKSMLTNDDVYRRWENSGAKIDLGEMSGKKSIQAYFDQKTAKKSLFRFLGDTLDFMGKYSEQPTRVGLFKKAYNKTGNDLLAAMESRDATVDFARMGSKMKVANSIIPFLNVGVQGFDKLIRAVKNNPGKVALMASIYGVAPQVASTIYNLQNHPKEYAEIPQFEKDNNFILITGRNAKGTVDYLTFPKGNILPLVANPAQSFLEYTYKIDGKSFGELATNLLSEALPVLSPGSTPKEVALKTIGSNLPQVIKPAAEALLNKSFYKYDSKNEQAKDIVPYFLQKEQPYNQKYDFTPVAYQKIGAALNMSPLVIQNTLEGYLAGYAKIPAQVVDMLYKVSRNEAVDTNDKTILRRFIKETYPSSNKEQIQQPEAPATMERMFGKVKAYEQSPEAPKTIPEKVVLAAKGIGVDPENTIKAIFTEERMRKISGNAMILERGQYLNQTKDKNDAVDHIIPLSLGGTNDPSNLRYISKEANAEKGKLEARLARELKAGKITKEEARKQVKEWVNTYEGKPSLIGKVDAAEPTTTIGAALKEKSNEDKAVREYREYLSGTKEIKSPGSYFKEKYGIPEKQLEYKVIKSLGRVDQSREVYKIIRNTNTTSKDFDDLIVSKLLTDDVAKAMKESGLIGEKQTKVLRSYIARKNNPKKKSTKVGRKTKQPKLTLPKVTLRTVRSPKYKRITLKDLYK